MGSVSYVGLVVLVCLLTASSCSLCRCVSLNQTASLHINASRSRLIPDTLFGIFFEEINHAGAGGLWAELVNNRGFEAGRLETPYNMDPWSVIGDQSTIQVRTDLSSCFEHNKVALVMEVLCDDNGAIKCPSSGVGIYNPGFWGMNIEEGKTYKVVLYIRSGNDVNVSISLTSSDGSLVLASSTILSDSTQWVKRELMLNATGSNTNSRLQLTATTKGVIWLDQVSVMPTDTYKGHGFRADLMEKLLNLEPRFIRFPGGCFVEGEWLRNAFHWKETVGSWETRPGHFGDVWNYWTDDGLGYLEFLQLAEDLGAAPVWVINNGISHRESVPPSHVGPFVQDMLDSIEFARGDVHSRWGSIRAAMGHPEPFEIKYIAIGNEDCPLPNYNANYLKFHAALAKAYPDIKTISNCDASHGHLDHPADFYDFHTYASAAKIFSMTHFFDDSPRIGPKAFVSEYAVTDKDDIGNGTLLAALAEAAFLLGVEKNSDVVSMTSYAPLFVNSNDRRWNPDAIVFNSAQSYGTPSYWMQHFFKRSSGASLLSSHLQTNSPSIVASVISWDNPVDNETYIIVKAVNFGSNDVNLSVSLVGLDDHTRSLKGFSTTILTSKNVKDENSFDNPTKVVPVTHSLEASGTLIEVVLQPHSFHSFDLQVVPEAVLPPSDFEAQSMSTFKPSCTGRERCIASGGRRSTVTSFPQFYKNFSNFLLIILLV